MYSHFRFSTSSPVSSIFIIDVYSHSHSSPKYAFYSCVNLSVVLYSVICTTAAQAEDKRGASDFFSGSTIMAASYTMLLCCACVQCVLFLISNHYAHAIFPFRLSTHIFHATSYEQCMKMACNRSTQFTYMRMFALLYHASQQYRDFLAIIFRMNHGRVFYFEVISFSHTNLISHRSRGNCSCTPL